MPDETKVALEYKLNFNLGYVMAQTAETNELLKSLMKADSPEGRKGLEDGKRQFIRDAFREHPEMTTEKVDMEEAWYETQDREARKQPKDAEAILSKYYDGLDGYGDEQLLKAIEKEQQTLTTTKTAKDMSDDDDRDPDPLGPPPLVKPGKEMTPEEKARFQAGTDRIMDDAKRAQKELDAIERMNKRREEQRERDKGRGR